MLYEIGNMDSNFEEFRKKDALKNINCEMIEGRVVRTLMAGEEGRKICFLIGTLLEDHMVLKKSEDQIIFGPTDIKINEINVFQPDLVTIGNIRGRNVDKSDQGISVTIPKLVIEILSEGNEVYDCLDKAVLYRKYGVKEYWVIDLKDQFIYTYQFRQKFDYKRYTFDQSIRSQCYPGFECCISDLLWEDEGGLKELALFYRFKQEMYPKMSDQLVAESSIEYWKYGETQYTAETFYEWMETRKNISRYTSVVELMLGNIMENDMPSYYQQRIRGELYYAVKSYLKNTDSQYQLCFLPTVVELKKLGMLDSVVVPDLFLIHKEEVIYNNIYRGVPEWIVEIVSPATASQDYIDKAQLYQYHGVKEYWIVNEWKKQVMVLEYKNITLADEENVETTIYGFEEYIPVKLLPGLEIKLEDLLE